MNVYSLVVFVHVFAGVYLVGHSLFSLYLRAAIRGAQTTSELRTWLSFGQRSTRLNPVAAMVLLVTGLFLGSAGWWTSPWFFASLALFLMSSALGARAIGAGAQALGRAVGPVADGPVPAQVDGLRKKTSWHVAFELMLAGDLSAIFLMTNEPGLWGTAATLAGCFGVVLLAGAALRRRSEAAGPGSAATVRPH